MMGALPKYIEYISIELAHLNDGCVAKVVGVGLVVDGCAHEHHAQLRPLQQHRPEGANNEPQ